MRGCHFLFFFLFCLNSEKAAFSVCSCIDVFGVLLSSNASKGEFRMRAS